MLLWQMLSCDPRTSAGCLLNMQALEAIVRAYGSVMRSKRSHLFDRIEPGPLTAVFNAAAQM